MAADRGKIEPPEQVQKHEKKQHYRKKPLKHKLTALTRII
jgi:hypothetical protein